MSTASPVALQRTTNTLFSNGPTTSLWISDLVVLVVQRDAAVHNRVRRDLVIGLHVGLTRAV